MKQKSNVIPTTPESLSLRRICESFAKFVPETVQRLVDANPETPDLSMRERDVSVLFVDISGYSSLSEQHVAGRLEHLGRAIFFKVSGLYIRGGRRNQRDRWRWSDGDLSKFALPRRHAVSADHGRLGNPGDDRGAQSERTRSRLSPCIWDSTPAWRWWASRASKGNMQRAGPSRLEAP